MILFWVIVILSAPLMSSGIFAGYGQRRFGMKWISDRTTHVDPVCGLVINPAATPLKTCYNGIEIYFCDESCKARFESAPQDYMARQRKGFWRRYLERVNKTTGGRPPSCCH